MAWSNTWVFPRSAAVPDWVAGAHAGIALRVTAHEPAAALCHAFGAPLVSTSANPHGQPPARDLATLERYFGERLDGALDARWADWTAQPSSGTPSAAL